MSAERWRCMPWEVTGERLTPWRRLRWHLRRQYFDEQRLKAMKK